MSLDTGSGIYDIYIYIIDYIPEITEVSSFHSERSSEARGLFRYSLRKAMRDHFGSKKIAWWDDYYKLECPV